MRKSDVAVVMPTCRGFQIPPQTIAVDWIFCCDRREREITHVDLHGRILTPGHLATKIIRPNPDIYGEGSSAIRSAGLDWAYSRRYPFVLSLDDDCILPDDWAESHVKALRGVVPVCNNPLPGYVIRGNTIGHHLPVGISHGLWSGVLDYPAWYQISADPKPVEIEDKGWSKIDTPFPMCGMNVGFRREALPAVFFQHTFRRHDDIFAGWMAQQVLGLHGYGFVSGGAVVRHERASNAEANLKTELPGDLVNKQLLDHIRGRHVTAGDVAGTYRSLAQHVIGLRTGNRESDDLIQKMAQSMIRWAQRRQV